LFIGIVTVILITDYFYAKFETQRSFERDIGLLWGSLEEPISNLTLSTGKQQYILTISELAWPDSQIKKLRTQGYLILEMSNGISLFHGYLSESGKVMVSELPKKSTINYQWFWLIIVYSALAAVIACWLYPLIRDIEQLQDSAIEFGKTKNYYPPKVAQGSAVAPIANALCQMTKRINRLMSLQRDIATYALHDIRTPLARMRFACELIDSPESFEIKSDIVEEIKEVENLLTELLRYAKFEYDQPLMNIRKANLHVSCKEVIEKLAVISAINIINNVPKDIMAYMEESLFKRALLNLVSNCLRYAKQNVWVSFSQQNELFCIIVEDDGPGINIDDLQNVTTPFVRKTNLEDNNSDENNSGLGLAIVETICLWHGGIFKVGNSTKHGGARFVFQWNNKCK